MVLDFIAAVRINMASALAIQEMALVAWPARFTYGATLITVPVSAFKITVTERLFATVLHADDTTCRAGKFFAAPSDHGRIGDADASQTHLAELSRQLGVVPQCANCLARNTNVPLAQATGIIGRRSRQTKVTRRQTSREFGNTAGECAVLGDDGAQWATLRRTQPGQYGSG